MPLAVAGAFTLNYTLRMNSAGPHLQFGMDFTVTQTGNRLPLTQLIFPAVLVGKNLPGIWSVDNHKDKSDDPACLIFSNADEGTIIDKPTEIKGKNHGVIRTKFAVYRVDVRKRVFQTHGVTFGYAVDTSEAAPTIQFTDFSTIVLPGDQKNVVHQRCNTLKYI